MAGSASIPTSDEELSTPQRQSSILSSKKKAKRTPRACDRCRCKKTKCDGVTNCENCRLSGMTCIYSHRRRGDARNWYSGMQEVVDEGFQRLYRACKETDSFPGTLPTEVDGAVTTEEILRGMGLASHPKLFRKDPTTEELGQLHNSVVKKEMLPDGMRTAQSFTTFDNDDGFMSPRTSVELSARQTASGRNSMLMLSSSSAMPGGAEPEGLDMQGQFEERHAQLRKTLPVPPFASSLVLAGIGESATRPSSLVTSSSAGKMTGSGPPSLMNNFDGLNDQSLMYIYDSVFSGDLDYSTAMSIWRDQSHWQQSDMAGFDDGAGLPAQQDGSKWGNDEFSAL